MKIRLLLFAAVLLLAGGLQAQHVRVTIGSGTYPSTHVPFCTYYNNGMTQQLYLANEVNQAGYIDTVWFYSSATASLSANSLKIYLGTTSNTSISSMLPASVFTEVFSGSNVQLGGAVGWQPFALDNPFYYDSSDNLVVAVCRQDDSYYNQVQFMCDAFSYGSGYVLLRQNDNNASYGDINANIGSAESSTTRANLRLSFDLNYSPSSCPKPTALSASNVTGAYAQLNWHETGSASSWQVKYGTSPINAGGAGSVLTVSDSSAFLTGLQPTTHYYVGVRAICGDGDTSQFTTCEFTTGCALIESLPFVQDFENAATGSSGNANFMPCWGHLNDAFSYPGYPYVISFASYNHTPNGSKGLTWNTGSFNHYQCFSLPGLDVLQYAVNNTQLRFWAQSNNGMELQVGVMTDPSDFNTFVPVYPVTVSSNSFAEYVCPLNNYTGNGIYVAVSAVHNGIWSGQIDDLSLEIMDPCPATSELSVVDSSANSITLSWTEYGSASQWVIEYGTSDFAPGSGVGTVVTANDTIFTLTGLDSAQTYFIYLHAVCGDDTSSDRFISASTMMASPATLPYFCDFEANDHNGWTLVNGSQPSPWFVGNGAHHGLGYRGLYISNNDGLSNLYDTANVVWSYQAYYAYRTLVFPEEAEYRFSFDWRAMGEVNYDYLRVWLVPGNEHFVAGVMPGNHSGTSFVNAVTPAGWIAVDGGHQLSGTDSWQSFDDALVVPAGTYHLVFMWCSDLYGGDQRPAAVDNVAVMRNGCPRIQNLHASYVGTDTVVLQWSAGGSESAWRVSEGSNQFVTTSTQFTFAGLCANSVYQFSVSPICAEDVTGFASHLSLRTACGPISHLPFVEDFEFCESGSNTSSDFIPCWYRLNNSTHYIGYPYVISGSVVNRTPGGSKGLYWFYNQPTWINADYFGDYYMVSLPPINTNLYSIDGLRLGFWAKVASNYTAHLEVGAMSDPSDSSTFEMIDSLVIPGSNTWQYYEVPLSGYTGQGGAYVSLRATRPDSAWAIYLDDFILEELSGCNAPSILASSAGVDTALIVWNGQAGNAYQVAFHRAGETGWSNAVEVNGTSYHFAGLLPETEYYFRVRRVCDLGSSSSWTLGSFVTDTLFCEAPANIALEGVGFSSVSLSWSPITDETHWGVRVWSSIFDSLYVATGTHFVASGLSSGFPYNAAVMALCGSEGRFPSAALSDTLQFTTLTCDPVSNVTNSVNGHSATILWTPGSNNSGNWEVRYGVAGFVQGDEIATLLTTTNSVSISGLESYMTYDAYVRAKCESGAYSGWSTKTSFYIDGVGIHPAEEMGGGVDIMPNPAKGSTSLSIAGVSGWVTVSIVDMNGRTVRSELLSCDGGCSTVLDLAGLPNGAYFVRVNGEGFNSVKKLIVK